MDAKVLYLLGCAAPPVLGVADVVREAQRAGWEVCLGLTPTARGWLADEVDGLAELTGRPVRSALRRPDETALWPDADVAVVAPATLNGVNTYALGLTPDFVAAYVAEAVGKRWPLAVLPCVNAAYATHPQFGRSVETLRGAGVRMLYGGKDGFVPKAPGEARPQEYPWHLALAAAREMAGPAGRSTGGV
ncbi:flavoprotein [Streptomyces sp. RKND-216]|uniref:flavoprotein n=1 Tax=Streptomyces sp. RKND-216 TaxID=2562581 RepID=UPI00109DF722|nr:flavoprotein [Streptomyces sp. RKND-216]THA25930.1 flavoprotein [Streptomyces sp. RKND-216]